MTDPLQDPGVQGLAQLGRNAIDRVAQLEAELSGYVEANRHMKGELDDALEDARKYCEAQREIARLRAELARVAEPARVIAAHAADAMAAKDMVIGALLDTLRQWQYAENNDDRDELANARTNRDEALAQVAELPE